VITNAVAALGGESLTALRELPALTRLVALLSLSWSGEVRIVERAGRLLLARARRRGVTEVAHAAAVLVNAYWRQGNVSAALDATETAIATDAAALMPAMYGHRAMLLAMAGRVDEAHEALELPGGESRWTAWAGFHGYLYGRIETHLLVGDFEAAFHDAQWLGALCGAMGTINPAVMPWRSFAAEAASALGRHDDARLLVEDELGLALRFGAPAPIARALRVLARTSEPVDALPLLDEAAALAAKTPNLIERTKIDRDRARVLSRLGRADEARAAADRAHATASRAGAVALAVGTLDVIEPGRRTTRHPDPHRPQLRVLGEFTVTDPNGAAVDLRGIPARAVRILIAAAKPLHAEELAESLWDEPLGPEQIRRRMHNVVNRARASRAPLLVRRDDLIAIHPDLEVDADRFDAAADRALSRRGDSSDAFDAAMTATLLYAGDFLPTDPYADWAMLRREQLRRRYLAVSDLAARLAAERGMTDTAIDVTEVAIRHDPYDVQRYEFAISVLESEGRHAAATAMAKRTAKVRRALNLS
jgi:DNA-binding SARP family transcriptional activator